MAMKREAVDNEEVFISAQISGMSCIVKLSKLVDKSIHLSMEGFLIWAPKKWALHFDKGRHEPIIPISCSSIHETTYPCFWKHICTLYQSLSMPSKSERNLVYQSILKTWNLKHM